MHLETAVALLPVILRSTQRCFPEWIPGIGRQAGAVGPGAKVIRGLRHLWGEHLNIPKSETTKKTILFSAVVQSWKDCYTKGLGRTLGGETSAISHLCVPFQGSREFAGVAATGILSHQSQSQSRGLHTLLQVRSGLGDRGAPGFLGGGKGGFIS